jgi:tetratricopeptide (TPR) repeat protein
VTPSVTTAITPAATSDSTPTVSTDPAENSKILTARGESDFKAGDYKSAVYSWKHALVDDPQNPVLLMMVAQGLFATGQFEEAAGATQAAMQMLPKDKWGVVVSNYKELYGNAQDYTDQLRALEKAVKDKPDNPALRFLLGYHYAYLGFAKEAVDQLDRGLKIAPQDEGAKQLRQEMQAKLPKPVAPPAAKPTPESPSAFLQPARTAVRLMAA